MYQSLGVTKQAVHGMIRRHCVVQDEELQLLRLVLDIRSDHPGMGVRDLYHLLQPEHMGRDAFEAWCKCKELQIKRKPNFRKTTDSNGVKRFENLLERIEINDLNQAWQSDITYFQCGSRFYFITFIIDSFSRRIIGHHTSKRLTTEQTTLPALRMALRLRKTKQYDKLIFHSDGGGQYYDYHFLELTKQYGIANSMCEYAWQNGKAERVNGIIKNNYLNYRSINSFEEMVREVDRAVKAYNQTKPHKALQRMSPVTFENKLLGLPAVNSGKLRPNASLAEVYHN